MARQADGVKAEYLRRVANEAFADLEAAKRMLQNPHHLPCNYVYQVVQADGVKAEYLRRIANEAIADLEAAKRMLQNPHRLPCNYVYQVVQLPAKKEINHKEAALKYGGQDFVDGYR